MAEQPFLSRQERFAVVASTNDVVRGWLADGTPEVCLAIADEQSAGRGRDGRTWHAPSGAALLMSLGFRPTWLPPDRAWRLAATASLAMADAAEEVAGLPDGTIRLKWPNDLVVEAGAASVALDDLPATEAAAALDATGEWLKLAGVLGESDGLGTGEPRVVIGLGINAGWQPKDFPPELAAGMTSLYEASRGRPIDLALLLDAFLGRLEMRVAALRAGRFDLADWHARQAATGRDVRLEMPDGSVATVRALDVDSDTGALVVADAGTGAERHVLSGDVRHLRAVPPTASQVAASGGEAATAASAPEAPRPAQRIGV
ncbi:MAG TPA: biotin--[acetyl-CoA-carboxylase] ligase [Candidatus Limnocylindrales bacterium]